jgi:hypothetical protein
MREKLKVKVNIMQVELKHLSEIQPDLMKIKYIKDKWWAWG